MEISKANFLDHNSFKSLNFRYLKKNILFFLGFIQPTHDFGYHHKCWGRAIWRKPADHKGCLSMLRWLILFIYAFLFQKSVFSCQNRTTFFTKNEITNYLSRFVQLFFDKLERLRITRKLWFNPDYFMKFLFSFL